MVEYEMNLVVHTEVIQSMNQTDICRLIDELSVLMQNQEAYITFTEETGFQRFLNVITGKQRKALGKIRVSQKEINEVSAQIMRYVAAKQVEMESDIQYLKKMVSLLSIYLIRNSFDLQEAGIRVADPSLLKIELEQQLEENKRILECSPINPSARPDLTYPPKTNDEKIDTKLWMLMASLDQKARNAMEAQTPRIELNKYQQILLTKHYELNQWVFYLDKEFMYIYDKNGNRKKATKIYAYHKGTETNYLLLDRIVDAEYLHFAKNSDGIIEGLKVRVPLMNSNTSTYSSITDYIIMFYNIPVLQHLAPKTMIPVRNA